MTIPNPYNLPEVEAALVTNANGVITVGSNVGGQLFAQGLNGNPAFAAPTLAVGAGAGSGATVGTQKGHDLGGSFVVTTAGTPAAGTLATITFGTPLAAAPAAVIVTCWDNTGAAAVAVGYSATATAITVLGPATTTAHALLISYLVIAS